MGFNNVPLSNINLDKIGISNEAVLYLLDHYGDEVEESLDIWEFNDYHKFCDWVRFSSYEFLCEFTSCWEDLYERGRLTLDDIKDLVEVYEDERGEAQYLLDEGWRRSEIKEAIREKLIELGVIDEDDDEELDESYRSRKFRASRKINENRASRRSFRRNRRR